MAIVNFSDIITFTRSTGGGRFNAAGQYEWLPANTPRIDYDPVTGECLGLLIEEQRTNLLTYSEQFDNAAWTKTRTSVSADTIEAPDGTLTADKLVEDTQTGFRYARGSASVAAGSSYTLSCYFKSGERTQCRLSFTTGFSAESTVADLATATILSGDGVITDAGGGWYRLWLVATATATGSALFDMGPAVSGSASYPGDGTSGIYLWGAQLEAGSFPTSYIPTTNAQVTRAADIASVNELSPWYNPNQGSFSIKAKGHIGEPLLTAGDASIIADSDELKEYQVSYPEDPQATQVDIGKGLIESIRYWPRETA